MPAAKTRQPLSALQARAELELRRRRDGSTLWPDQYTNATTGKVYTPHNDQEAHFVTSDNERYLLLKGGEGGGKSVAGIIKNLERLRRGMDGIMVSPDLEHFKKSLWPEFVNWCPWHRVIERQRYRQRAGWEPTKAFTLVFENDVNGTSKLICGGAKESEIGSWEGPNVSFIHFDEARRHKEPVAIKTFDGRARIPGPNGESPQIYFTTTPRKHWLYEYFAGAPGDEESRNGIPDKMLARYAEFKQNAYVATVLTRENAANLEEGFADKRALTFTTESEIGVHLLAKWEDEEDFEKFVNITWWDACQQPLPALDNHTPMVLALDAAKGGETNRPDCFAMVGVTKAGENVLVRYCGIWQPGPGELLDFAPIEAELARLCRSFAVIEVAYDPYQLHDMATRLKNQGLANFKEFGQMKPRLMADKQLQDLIMSRRIMHDGNPLLRQHIDNANIKKHGEDGIRLIKRSTSLKIDAGVALSMACSRALYYNT